MNLVEMAPNETSLEAGGYVKGVAIGIVTQNRDPDGLCRVKVRFPWHDQPRESYWARLAVPMAGKERGMVMIPEVDDEVLVAFEREDLRFPYVLGALWNGKDKPPLANDDGNNDRRVLQSRSHHYLLFNDGASGFVELKKDDGKRVIFDKDGILLEDGKGNQLKIESNSGAFTLQAKRQLTIKAETVTIESSGTLDVKASGTLTLSGQLVNIN